MAAPSPMAPKAIAEVLINGSLGHNGRLIELQVIKVLTNLGMHL